MAATAKRRSVLFRSSYFSDGRTQHNAPSLSLSLFISFADGRSFVSAATLCCHHQPVTALFHPFDRTGLSFSRAGLYSLRRRKKEFLPSLLPPNSIPPPPRRLAVSRVAFAPISDCLDLLTWQWHAAAAASARSKTAPKLPSFLNSEPSEPRLILKLIQA